MKQFSVGDFPTVSQLERELRRVKYRSRLKTVILTTVYTLITVSAAAVLVATLFLPVLQIYGESMSPTLSEGETVVALKNKEVKSGDIVAFYYNNKILIKRVVAAAGDTVNIGSDGTVYVNGEALEEPYLSEKSRGTCDIDLPYSVPEGRYFVMGDRRSVSADSRMRAVGCVSQEQIIGKVIVRIWPLGRAGGI